MDRVIGKKGTLRKDCGPRKIRARYQPLGSKDLGFICIPRDKNGERVWGWGRGDTVKGHNRVQSPENPVAPVWICLEREHRRGQL